MEWSSGRFDCSTGSTSSGNNSANNSVVMSAVASATLPVGDERSVAGVGTSIPATSTPREAGLKMAGVSCLW